ncbi:MAG: enoyl-CoA hydratase/isomerase family protein, partial [Deltaproteobacteria bacterium]|nr:enoyl-CoA hydratase/isomerase family protein [Deltaproteobacteria bacterium]
FTVPMMDSLCRALRRAAADEEIKVVILTGAGEAFSSGGNVKEMAAGQLRLWEMKNYLWEHVQRVPQVLAEIDKPVIAAVNGLAYGGGFDLALACDFRFASRGASFCSTFVRIGLAPGNGGAFFLPRLVGRSRALDILLTGRRVEAAEALSLGLVDRLYESDELLPAALQYAEELARWPLAAIRAIKRAVIQGEKSDLRSHLDYLSSQLALLAATDEHRQAVEKLVRRRR